MKKIIVIGCPGAGKSCFSRRLRDKYNLPLYYLDMMWHLPDRTNVTREEFAKKLEEILKKDSWIIDGNYISTMEMRLKYCDTVFLLDYPLDVCLDGARRRIGTKREDMPWMEEEFDEEFKQWILDFPEKQLPRVYQLLQQYKEGKEIHIFKTREEADKYLDE